MKNLFLSAAAILTGVLCTIGCGSHNAANIPATASQTWEWAKAVLLVA